MSRTVRKMTYTRADVTRTRQPRPAPRRTSTRSGILAATSREG